MIRILSFSLLCYSLLVLAGCSASSRYSQKEEKKTEKSTSVRFSSEDPQASTINPDSTFTDFSDEDDPDDMPEDETGIDITEVVKTFRGKETNSDPSAELSNYKEIVLMEIIKYLNTPYKFGGNSKKGIDCSAFTQTVYANTLAHSLLRSAREQYTQGTVISGRDELEFGDLVFFNTRKRVRPGHVGIYIGDNLFAHASSKHGVIVSSLDHEYYSKRYMGGRRFEDVIP